MKYRCMDECLDECNYLRRQYFGSYLAMADVNEEARMKLMGHKQPHMTMMTEKTFVEPR